MPGFSEPTVGKRCVHLDRANHCVIYSSRPDACRIKPGTHLKNANACVELQELLQIRGKTPNRRIAAANDLWSSP